METEDMALLREYAAANSEEAFRTIVERHLDMVYATALRQVQDPQLAQEVTQAVFVVLARKAGSLPKTTILAGWLFRAARFAAANAKRSESRRQHWEQKAAMEPQNHSLESEAPWEKILPLLNDALAQLSELDRSAIILRFFENKSLQQVGTALGTSEPAAKMRLSRAMEKLRQIFQKRGVVLPAAALLAALSTHGSQAAPAGLASSILTSALLKTATTSALTKGILIMASTKQKAAIAAALATLLLAGGGTTALILHHSRHQSSSTAPPVSASDSAAQPEIVFSTSDSETGQRDRAKAAVRQIENRLVLVPPHATDGEGEKDTLTWAVKGGTNGSRAVMPLEGGTVVVRRRASKRAGAPATPQAGLAPDEARAGFVPVPPPPAPGTAE